MEIGFCTHCGSMVLDIHTIDWKGNISTKTFKREKAKKHYEKLEHSIIGDYYGKIKYGSKANMGFRYGNSKEVRNRSGEIVEVRSYAVDFNGTKELVKTAKVG